MAVLSVKEKRQNRKATRLYTIIFLTFDHLITMIMSVELKVNLKYSIRVVQLKSAEIFIAHADVCEQLSACQIVVPFPLVHVVCIVLQVLPNSEPASIIPLLSHDFHLQHTLH